MSRIDTIDMYHAIQIAKQITSTDKAVIGNLMPWQKKTNWTQRVEGEHSCSKKISRAALIDLMHSDGVIQNDKSLLNCYKFPHCQWIVKARCSSKAQRKHLLGRCNGVCTLSHIRVARTKLPINGALPSERRVWGGGRGDAKAFTPNKQIE